MPIHRTFVCPECNLWIEQTLSLDQWELGPPDCPACRQQQMQQEFTPPAIVGSPRAKAVAIAEDIAATDYGVADMKVESYEGVPEKVRYKDVTSSSGSIWGATPDVFTNAIAAGRQAKMESGGMDGLDVLQRAIKSGDQPDLIELSKRRSAKVW